MLPCSAKRIRLKTSLVEIASAVERMVLPVDTKFEKDQTNDADKLIIHDMVSHNSFSLYEDRGNFNSSSLFGLYDIFNYLISPLHYDKYRLAAYKSFQDYRLFDDDYVLASPSQSPLHLHLA